MPNQREIARSLGLNQATVSLALRGDHSIPEGTRKLVRAQAKKMGYHANSYVSLLMSRIRAGRKISDRGSVAIVVQARSEKEWHRHEPYRHFYQGVRTRAAELGYDTECFYLSETGMTARRIDRVLQTRGVQGLIFAPPYRGEPVASMDWSRYSCLSIGHDRSGPQMDRLANDHYRNTTIAFSKMRERGYRKIGLCLPLSATGGLGSLWHAAYLQVQSTLHARERVPVFMGYPRETELSVFRRWFLRWRPDAMLTLVGDEMTWLGAMKRKVPEDLGLVCLIRPHDSAYAGVEEKNITIGATALAQVVGQIQRNEFGLPQDPKTILVEGRWVEGNTLPVRSRQDKRGSSSARTC